MKKNIAIVTGGYSKESDISVLSAKTVFDNVDKEKNNYFFTHLYKDKWYVEHNNGEYPIDKNDFSWNDGEKKVKFDLAFIALHGTPGEDGLLQGYFEMLNIPYSTGDHLSMSITFNKWVCNQFLIGLGFCCGKSLLLKDSNNFNLYNIAEEINFPCFVKPNTAGSSVGVSKVPSIEELEFAIRAAFDESKEVMIEEFIEGTEVTCGVFEGEEGLMALPITELVSQNEFFDYAAKYKGESEEITPARIPDSIKEVIQEKSKKIFKILNLKGIARIDYIIKEDIPFLIEINTIPGLSKESIIPQQIENKGLKISDVFNNIIQKLLS